MLARFPVRILGADCKGDSTAGGELRGHDHFAGRTRFYEIVENAVCDGFIECALVTIGTKIKFQRLAFDAESVRHVIDIDPSKIGLTGNRTNGSEIVRFEMNTVIAFRNRIRKRLQVCLGGRGW